MSASLHYQGINTKITSFGLHKILSTDTILNSPVENFNCLRIQNTRNLKDVLQNPVQHSKRDKHQPAQKLNLKLLVRKNSLLKIPGFLANFYRVEAHYPYLLLLSSIYSSVVLNL